MRPLTRGQQTGKINDGMPFRKTVRYYDAYLSFEEEECIDMFGEMQYEREQRYDRLRAAMREGSYDALLIVGRYDMFQMGYLRYVSNWRVWAGCAYAVFPADGDPAMVIPAKSQTFWARNTSWIKDIRFSANPLIEVKKLLIEFGIAKGALGIVGMNEIIAVNDYLFLREKLPEVQFSDASDLFDRVRVVKSAEEIVLMEEDAKVIAKGFRHFGRAAAPGKTEWEVAAEVQSVLRTLGGLDGIVHLSNTAPPYIHPPTERVIQPNDVIKFSIEFSGPSGYWTELGGIFSFREDHILRRRFNTVLKAFNTAARMLKPGTVAGDVVKEIKQVYQDGGKISSRGLWDMHSIGLDVIERPIILEGDSTVLEKGMVFCLHPGLLVDEGWGVYIQDSFVVTENGGRQLSDLTHQWNIIS